MHATSRNRGGGVRLAIRIVLLLGCAAAAVKLLQARSPKLAAGSSSHFCATRRLTLFEAVLVGEEVHFYTVSHRFLFD